MGLNRFVKYRLTIWKKTIVKFFISMELEPFFCYFFIDKTLSMSSDKYLLAYIDQYSLINNIKGSIGGEICGNYSYS